MYRVFNASPYSFNFGLFLFKSMACDEMKKNKREKKESERSKAHESYGGSDFKWKMVEIGFVQR